MMRDEMRLPRVLDTRLKETARVHPLEMSLDLHLRACHTGKISLPDEDPRLADMPFVDVYTAKGQAGIFRIYDSTEPVSGIRSYTLRHGIDTLRDSLWREKTNYDGTVPGFLQALLSWQTTAWWRLGTCADTGAYKRDKINYDPLDKLLDELRESREGYYFSYDFSTTPWTLHFLPIAGVVNAEMRPSRNLSDASLRRTRNGMVNRLYLSVDGSVPSAYNNAAAQEIYGVVEGTAAVTSAEAPVPWQWAGRFLADHGEPIQSVSGEAMEIVKATGEAWDAFDLGKLARVVVPGREGFPITLPIETLRYEGLAGTEPEKVRAELQKRLPKFSEQLSSARKKADEASDEAEETQAALEDLSETVAQINFKMVPKTSMVNQFSVFVGESAPAVAGQSNVVWIKPGAEAGAGGAYPCEIFFIP